MINPKWLSGTFIIENEAIDYDSDDIGIGDAGIEAADPCVIADVDGVGVDPHVVDIGGATTDVHSAVTLAPHTPGITIEGLPPLPLTRSVQGDLGMRWSASGVYAADRDWLDGKTTARAWPGDSAAVGARRRMEILKDAITLFDDGQEILPGIAARATYGHTPGHMSFELRSGSESVMVLGDAVTTAHVGFERPAWHSGSDQDPATAAVTRTALLDQLSHDQIALIGYHLPDGGIGRAERSGDAYRFVPHNA